ncbi:ribonuclease H-like domain-containing protein [Rhizophagus clarus]|uniref:Ribonuclease H-like domain-containing protein n=1 Tax=Rhizophagus clarus TaxID=94130 RepID=A0A8H3MFC6_9GLOM|nr:ribonuclease H-like domain-containing protein [Rhizophagus clarus]
MTAFYDSTNLPDARINRINCALVKFFVYCGIAFRIVEHPFFIDFLKELNADYNPSIREYLSSHLLETELCNVNEKMNEDIMNQRNLTLALDGWTSGHHQSIWNFILLTPSHKEYLYQLSDLSLDSHTAEYLAVQIKNVIKKVGPDQISAIVSDNAANIKKARAIIHEKYLKIESIRCVSHCINLIACDIVSHNFADKLLRKVNILTAFFRNSYIAGDKFQKLIEESGIKGNGLKSYCITRWTISSELVNSILNLKPVLEKAILSLESRSTTLTDCYLSLVQLEAVLKNLPQSFHCSFRNHCYDVMNKRFKEFNDDKYFLYVSLKSGIYAKLAKMALSISQNLGFDLKESRALYSQLSQYKKKESPFDLDFGHGFQEPINWWNLIETDPYPDSLPKVALHLFSIYPNSASCKRGFSNLGWLTNKRYLQLEVRILESIELNKIVTEVLTETDNIDDDEDNEFELENPIRRTINGEIIPDDNVVVLIEKVWIEDEIDLTNNLILKDIGNIPKDLDDDFIDNEKNNNEDIILTDDETVNDTNGRGKNMHNK